jgi:hypothetical protein
MGRSGFILVIIGWRGFRWLWLDPVRFMAKVSNMSGVGRFSGLHGVFCGDGRGVS